eukprot:scaffold10092_cov72-Skeletonema_marinoi.AAC.1
MSPLMVYQHDSPAAMNSKRSTNKFRARNMVLVSCIDEFACRFPTGCPYGLDEATIQKRQAIEAYCSIAIDVLSRVGLVLAATMVPTNRHIRELAFLKKDSHLSHITQQIHHICTRTMVASVPVAIVHHIHRL